MGSPAGDNEVRKGCAENARVWWRCAVGGEEEGEEMEMLENGPSRRQYDASLRFICKDLKVCR
jgi:hypothetical protein